MWAIALIVLDVGVAMPRLFDEVRQFEGCVGWVPLIDVAIA